MIDFKLVMTIVMYLLNRSDKARSFRDEDSDVDDNPESFYPPPHHPSRSSCKKCKVDIINFSTLIIFDGNRVDSVLCTFVRVAEPCPSAQ